MKSLGHAAGAAAGYLTQTHIRLPRPSNLAPLSAGVGSAAEGGRGRAGTKLFQDFQMLSRIWTHPWCLQLDYISKENRVGLSARRPKVKTEKMTLDAKLRTLRKSNGGADRPSAAAARTDGLMVEGRKERPPQSPCSRHLARLSLSAGLLRRRQHGRVHRLRHGGILHESVFREREAEKVSNLGRPAASPD